MKKIAAMLVGAAALVVLTAAPAAAQDNELGVGLTLLKWNWNWDGAKGFAVDFGHVVHKAPTSAMSIIVDFSRNSNSDVDETDTSIVGGVRERFCRDQRFSPFVQGTAGVVHWADNFFGTSGNDFMIGGGGGVQIRLTDMVDAKVQYDAWRTRDSDFHDWDWITRWYFGVTFKLGAK